MPESLLGSEAEPQPPANPALAELHVVPPDALVVLEGEIDLHNLHDLQQVLGVATAAAVRRLTVDLTRVEFASLGALAALVDTARVLAARRGRVTLQGARPLHLRVIGLMDPPAALDLGPAG